MAGTGWRVTGQVSDVPMQTDAGRTVTGVQVYFTTAEGNSGSVFIENSRYSAATVRDHIRKASALLDEVGRLAEGAMAEGG